MLSYIKTLRMEEKHSSDLEKANSEGAARQIKPIFKIWQHIKKIPSYTVKLN